MQRRPPELLTLPTRVGIDGRDYEIDLSEENAGKLREALAPFIDAARLIKWPRGRRRS